MCEYFGSTDGFTVDCKVVDGIELLFLLCGVVIIGCIEKIICCVVVGKVSTISSFEKNDCVLLSCCVTFVILLKFFFVFKSFKFRLLLLIQFLILCCNLEVVYRLLMCLISINFYVLRWFVTIPALETPFGMLKNKS